MSGTVTVSLKDTKKYEHLGIKCYLIGYLGTEYLMQKFTPIKIYRQSSTRSQSNLNLLEFWQKIRPISSSFPISRRSIKLSTVLLDVCVTLFVWSLPKTINFQLLKSRILLFYFPMNQSSAILKWFPWRWKWESRIVFI